ncbi:MAG: protein-disulfide reductase DsbD [Wenzhouxiangellaceae bacterium]|nr:protein-disulfide reductase DsbD [Wenzhouxiangellaceae bacterium]
MCNLLRAGMTGLAGLWLAALSPLPAGAQINPDDLLPVEEAFAMSASVVDGGEAVGVRWDVADGYYMYRHAFKFEPLSEGLELGPPEIAPGKSYSDEFFGDVEIYRGKAAAVVPIRKLPADGPIELRIAFQGCADLGVCYPPQRERVSLERPVAAGKPAEPAVEPVRSAPAKPSGGLNLEGFGTARELTGRGEPLPPEQAFRVETIALGPGELLARFTTHPDYYLYRDTIAFESALEGIEITGTELPAARAITDEYFGDTYVYFGQVEIPVALARPAGPATELPLIVKFQGCQVDGICYPPMQREIRVDLPAAGRALGAAGNGGAGAASESVAPESEQDRLARLIEEQPLALTLALFVLLGIGLAFTPCVFPMIPILSGIIAGEGEHITRGKAFALSLAYVLAMALTYTGVGVVAALAGYNLQMFFQNPWVLSIFAAVFVALALAMFGFYNLQMPARWQAKLTEISNRQSGGSVIGAGIMGFLSALIVGPCVTAPLIGILIFISQTGDAVLGGSVLFALSIGMGVPLLAIGVGLGSWLPRAGAWMEAVKAVFGVGLLALAIWMLERIVPGAVTMLLWGALLVASGVYLGALTRLPDEVSGWRKLWQATGVILLVLGVAQFVGVAAGGNDWLRPLAPFAASGTAAGPAALAVEFAEVDNLAEIERAVAASDRPVMLDFYADWCISCKEMERYTFPDPEVAATMGRFTLLKIDMTDFNDEHQQVLTEFGLIGPPAYLFFGGGEELPAFRLFGFVPADDFVGHLARVEQAAR